MKTMRWLTVTALALGGTAAHATNGMRMIGFGPVQNSMGGVSVGAPLDAATVITNPAGMSLVGGRIDFGATYFQPTVKYTATGVASGAQQTSDRGASPVPAFGLVMQRDEKLTVGIGAYGIAGMGVDYPQDLFGDNLYTSYSQMRFAPGFAYEVLPNLSVGVVANVMYATMEYKAGGMYPRDSAASYGFGATLGVTYTPVDVVTIAAAYETKSTFQDFAFNIPEHDIVVNTAGATMTVGPGTEKLEFDQPSVATLGLAVRPVAGLVVAADLQWIRWSETSGKRDPELQTNPQLTGISPWSMKWNDQVVIKVGGEYAATSWLRLRAGYNYGKNPLDTSRYFENVAFPAVAEHHVTAGAGLALGKMDVNFAATYSPEKKVSGTGSQPFYDDAMNPISIPVAYETKMSQLAFDVGVAYRF